MTTPDITLYQRPAELLQQLIRFDTTNPPGNEIICISWIADLLRAADIPVTLLAKDDNRPNLIARLKGRGDAPPLLLQGHVDVVTTAGQQWDHDPFGGELIDGFIWGRGTLDMKGGVAMMIAAMLRAKVENLDLPGDVILTVLSDEEAGGVYGAKFLVEEHPEQFEEVQFALGEFGGTSLDIGGQRFYPLMVAEKQGCKVKLTIEGPAGHGSMPIRGGAMAKLSRVLWRLDNYQLPVHVSPVVKQMLTTVAENTAFPISTMMRQLTNPRLTNRVLRMMGERGRVFGPMLHNTVSPTIVQGGDKINVIPGEISLSLDGRLLPGYTPDDMASELGTLVGHDAKIEIVDYEPGPPAANMQLFDTLSSILREADPDGIAVPMLLMAVTDARHFARLGIQTYGFTPMQLPSDFNFSATIHAANERIPVEAMSFGTNAIFKALQRFGG
ncbi:MAG: M20/M25/M40 family metallo-hydrolase [Chloroflexota bacterium]